MVFLKIITDIQKQPMLYRAFFLCLFFLVASCQKETSSPQQLEINLCQDPTSLDPILVRNLSSLFIARHLHDGLFRYHDDQLQQALCESFSVSEDGCTYTIKLKKAFFSDGSLIRAQDFVDSLARALTQEVRSDYIHLSYVIKNAMKVKSGNCPLSDLGIRALEDLILEYQLESPHPDFPSILAHPVFFPSKYLNKQLLFSGPFVLKSHQPSLHLQMVKNEKYFDKDSVYLQRINGHFIDNQTALLMFEKGRLHFIGSPLGIIPQEAIVDFQAKNKILKKPWLGIAFLRLNTLKAPLNDSSFRRMLSNNIERQKITSNALQNLHIPTEYLLPSIFGLNEKNNSSPHQMTYKVNFSHDGPLKLKFSSSDVRMQNIACIVKSELEQKTGIKIDLVPRESKMLLQDISKQDFEMILGSWIADVYDPENFLDLFEDSHLAVNGTGWENLKYKTLLQQARIDQKLSKTMHMEAQNLLLNESPIIPLFQFNLIYAKDEKLEGFTLNSLGILDFKHARL
jgi:oligopeptide transport system substrate-binding protein